jgi:hypothetical protein
MLQRTTVKTYPHDFMIILKYSIVTYLYPRHQFLFHTSLVARTSKTTYRVVLNVTCPP